MFHFAWVWLFLLLPLPWALRFVLPQKNETSDAILTIPFYHRVVAAGALENVKFSFSTRWVDVVKVCIWFFLVLAMTRPEWLGQPIAIEQRGRDIMLAIDISGSMGSRDLSQGVDQASRLDIVQNVASEFVSKRVGDRVGLLLFGTRAYVQTPLSYDRQTVIDMLEDASIGLAGPQTAMGDSIGLAIKHLLDLPEDSRVIILLTDGANNAGSVSPVAAAKLAAKEKIKIYTVGVGAESVTINTLFGQQKINPSEDLDEKTLQTIADLTGGLYFRAKDKAGLQQVYAAINRLEPYASESQIFQPILPLYPWPLGFALLLSLLLVWILAGRII